jgi:hypothetical protein
MSRLGRPFQAIGRRLREVHRSLGPRWTAALAVGVLAAAGAGTAVALAGGHTSAPRAGTTSARVTTQSTAAPSTASGLASAGAGAAAKRHVSSSAKRGKRVVPAKPAAKQAGSKSASASHHSSAATHTTGATHGPAHTTTTATTPPARPVPMTLDLHGGGNASLVACGSRHHFRTYAGGSTISFTGRVRPLPGRQWKVELHTKICQGGVFQDFLKYDAHINPSTGAFYGTFRAPPRGLYEFESVLYLGGNETPTESDNVSIEIR